MRSAGSVSSDGGERIVQWWSPFLQMAFSVSPGGGRCIGRSQVRNIDVMPATGALPSRGHVRLSDKPSIWGGSDCMGLPRS